MENKKIDVEAISRLARLELDDNEKQRLEREMRQFDDFAACLGATCVENRDSKEQKPLSSCSREDVCLPSDVRADELISLSLGAKDGYISVPITVGKEDGGV